MAGLTPFQFSSGKRMYNVAAPFTSATAIQAADDALAWQEMWINPSNVKWDTKYRQTQKQTAQAIVTYHFRPEYQVLTCSGTCGWFRLKSELEEVRDAMIIGAAQLVTGAIPGIPTVQNGRAKEAKKIRDNARAAYHNADVASISNTNLSNAEVAAQTKINAACTTLIPVAPLYAYSDPATAGTIVNQAIADLNPVVSYNDGNNQQQSNSVWKGSGYLSSIIALAKRIYYQSPIYNALITANGYSNVSYPPHAVISSTATGLSAGTYNINVNVNNTGFVTLPLTVPPSSTASDITSAITSAVSSLTASININAIVLTSHISGAQSSVVVGQAASSDIFVALSTSWSRPIHITTSIQDRQNSLSSLNEDISTMTPILSSIKSQTAAAVESAQRDMRDSEAKKESMKGSLAAAEENYKNTTAGGIVSNNVSNVRRLVDDVGNAMLHPTSFLKSGHSNRLNNSPSLFLSRLKGTADEPMYYIDKEGVEHYNPKYIKMFTKQFPDGIIYQGYFTTFGIIETPDFETVGYDFVFVAEQATPVTLLQRVLGMFSGTTSIIGDAINIVGV